MGKTGGGRGTNQHKVRGTSLQRTPGLSNRYADARPEPALELAPETHYAVQLEDFDLLPDRAPGLRTPRHRSTARALARYRARRADIAFSGSFLEGNTFTLPEVYTLLEGQVPAGKTEREVDQVLDLARGSEQLLSWVENGDFTLDLERSDQLNAILSAHEVIQPGVRRSRSHINSDGRGATVNLMGEDSIGMDQAELAHAETVLIERAAAIKDPVLRAVNYAAMATYMQMYFDGNKRTARYMADGELVTHGFDAIAIPAARASEYHQALAEMFRTANATPYALFLLDVLHRDDPVAPKTAL